jgi:hypothetical protein
MERYTIQARAPGEDWNGSGCWGGEYAHGLNCSDAEAAMLHLSVNYPDVEWGMFREPLDGSPPVSTIAMEEE